MTTSPNASPIARIERPIASWLPPAWIPNTTGKLLVVALTDGTTLRTEVVKGADGLHRLADVPSFSAVTAWQHRTQPAGQ